MQVQTAYALPFRRGGRREDGFVGFQDMGRLLVEVVHDVVRGNDIIKWSPRVSVINLRLHADRRVEKVYHNKLPRDESYGWKE